MKKIISLLLCIILTFSCVISVGAYSFNNNGTATKKATAYRLPSVNSGDVWWVDKNDKLQVFCQDGDYYLVLYPFNNTGKHVIAYVPTSAVSTSGVPSSSNFYKSEIVRTKSNANLYHNPSTDTLTGASGSNQTVRTTVSKGQELTVLFEKDGFYCVRTSNDTGFIEKNKICTHSNTSNKNEKITVVKKDDNTHTVTTAYDEVCNDCGKTVKSNQKKTNSEKHAISNDKCTKCGYEAPVIEEKCNHSNTKENWQSSTVSQKDDTYHTVEEIYDVLCVDCGETIKKLQNKVYDEKHILKNDDCEKCSYVVPGSEASKCKHTNTAKHSSEDMKTTISIKDDNQHTIASYYHVWCTDCFTYIKENELDLVHEDHKFVNNICSVCNLEKFVEKTAYVYNTDGDNLNMRSQANSSSSIVVKIPAGASLTVTGDIINGFYPVKYNGKTGYASAAYITFTKPSVNKTAYVYNTDGANLNMRSGANKNASIVTKMPEGSTLTVTGDATNGFYPVKYGNHSGYASTAYITFTKPSTTAAALNSTTIISNSKTDQKKSQLTSMMNGSSHSGTYKIDKKYTGPYSNEQCKGFAKSVFMQLFGYNIGSTTNGGYGYQINYSSSKTTHLGSLTSLTTTNVKNLFSKARPGDFVQMNQKGSYSGPHSAIVYEVSASGVTFYECNLDWKNTITKNYYSWQQIVSGKSAISVYTAKGY